MPQILMLHGWSYALNGRFVTQLIQGEEYMVNKSVAKVLIDEGHAIEMPSDKKDEPEAKHIPAPPMDKAIHGPALTK